jgi:hypothetical protein
LSAWELFGPTEHRVLRSPLSPAACRDQLREETGSIWNPFSAWSHPVRGRVTDQGFWIVRSKRYRNSFEIEARGTWQEEGGGTRIDLTLGVMRWTRGIMIVWLSFMTLFCIGWLAAPVPKSGAMPAPVERIFPVLILAFGLLMIRFGRWLAREEPRQLLEFLCRVLECPPDSEAIS